MSPFSLSCLCFLFLFSLFSLPCLSLTVIVADEYGSQVALPMTGGHVTGGFAINNAEVSLSTYNVSVYITNEYVDFEGVHSQLQESFYVLPSYGQGALIHSYYQAGVLDPNTNKLVYSSPVITGDYVGSSLSPNSSPGRYVFQFNIPLYAQLIARIVYSNVGNPTTTDYVTVNVVNSASSNTLV